MKDNEIIELKPAVIEGEIDHASSSYDFAELAEHIRYAASDIAWLASLATDNPYNACDDFRHNLSKADIVETIGARLKHLQEEFEALRQRAEREPEFE